ncbi:MAG: hypothetical protein Q9174_001860 [Haloplaca sp. 1 TL-2023]
MPKDSKKPLHPTDHPSSSKAPKPPTVNSADEEIARRLDQQLNPGRVVDADDEDAEDGQCCPVEIQTAIDYAQLFAKDIFNTTCHACDSYLIDELDLRYWINSWKATRGMKSATPTSAVKCDCGAFTCLGCAEKPRRGDPKFMTDHHGLKLDWCCNKGAAFVAWVLLCQYDDQELRLQERSSQNQAASKMYRGKKDLSGGVGYGCHFTKNPFAFDPMHTSSADEGYRRGGIRQALNFHQVDSDTDRLTEWIIGVLVELLPKRNETERKVSPALASMVELSLLQDRLAELLRNDSLQDVDKRASLYFKTFEFVSRLGNHQSLDYLACEERFMKKQSAGLYVISTEDSGRGKHKAQAPLTVASGLEGKASSLISCLSKLATQSRVLLSGSTKQVAGNDIWQVAKKIDSLYGRLADTSAKDTAITTWKGYHEAHCLERRADVARYLSRDMYGLAQQHQSSAKGRMSRLVTEASEMATSLPTNIFVKVDEVRPDVMKARKLSHQHWTYWTSLLTNTQALIIGPTDTPYDGGLFEFDIVCGGDYPATPPSVWFLTTGRGVASFNPNLYGYGKVCLSLINTWPSPDPASQWQPYKSTLHSVLVSIQAMILWKWPYENEPTHEGAHLKGGQLLQRCLAYNEDIRFKTLRYATLDWLTRREMRDGLWKHVVRDYFRFCGKNLVERWRQWEHSKGKYSMFGGSPEKKIVDELEAAIEKIRR